MGSDVVERSESLPDELRRRANEAYAATGINLSMLHHVAHKLEMDAAEITRLRKNDREAACHVESVICMRTNFTGDKPYVGWKGLGLALSEALDERDRLRSREALIDELVAALTAMTDAFEQEFGTDEYEPDESSVFVGVPDGQGITFGLLRRARTALSKARGET